MCFAICVCCDVFFETSLRLGHTTISQLVLQVGGLLPFWNPTNPRRSGIGKMWSTGSGTQGACVQPPGPIATCLAARSKMSWWRKRMRGMRPLPLSRLRLLPFKKSRIIYSSDIGSSTHLLVHQLAWVFVVLVPAGLWMRMDHVQCTGGRSACPNSPAQQRWSTGWRPLHGGREKERPCRNL